MLKRAGIRLKNTYDTMLVEQLFYNGFKMPKGFFTLEETHLRHTGFNPYGNQLSLFAPYVPKKTRISIASSKGPLTYEEIFYATTDLDTTLRVYKSQTSSDLITLESEFALVLGDMEINGMPVNIERWMELVVWSRERMEKYQQQLIAHKEINWNSHLQVKKEFKLLGLRIDILDSKTGLLKESIEENVIQKYRIEYPIVDTYLEYKRYQKLSTTYGEKFLRFLSNETGRIHSEFLQLKHTGRISSTKPNQQNIIRASPDFPEGRWWREAFESNDYFVIADYSKQELFAAAFLSQDETLLRELLRGEDLHRKNAATLLNKPEDQVTDEERTEGKTCLFSLIYGAGPDKVAKQFKVTMAKAKTMHTAILNRYPKLRDFQKASFEASMRNGYITIGERRCYIAEIDRIRELDRLRKYYPKYEKEYRKLVSKVFRDSSNYPIQGLGALITKYAAILIRRKLTDNIGKLLLLVHDEIITECKFENTNIVKEIVESCMEQAVSHLCNGLKIPVEAKISKKWIK